MARDKSLYYFGNRHLITRCLSYFLPYKFKVVIAFLSMFVVAGCSAAMAYLVKPAIDQIFVNKDMNALKLLPFLIMGVMVTKCSFRFIQTYYMNSVGMRVIEALRNDLYKKIVVLPMRFFEESQVGMLMSRILNDVVEIRNSVPSMVMLIREIFEIMGLIGVVFYQDAELAFYAVIVVPIAGYPLVYFGKKLRNLGRKSQAGVANINVHLQESFSGIKVIKAFATEKQESGRFAVENHKLMGLAIKQVLNSELSSRVIDMLSSVGIGLVIFYGGMRVIDGTTTAGTFFSFMASLIMLYEPIKKIDACNIDIQRALAGAERVFDILDSPNINRESGGTRDVEAPFKSVEFRDVRFQYPTAGRPALDGINLVVRAGERVAIVGPSGSGKTTLVHLIPRFYDADSGQVLLNGAPVQDYSLKSLRLTQGIVSQDAFLFNASVRDNICYGQDGYSQEQIESAAKAAFAHDFIMELPDGYDTVIGERGARLSGGQKQRLTIARALLKNPPLLILDEATSALDTESERIVQLALENLMRERTSIVIAHRLSTILSAHLIVVMEEGRVVAQGKHAKLLETCPLYARLYQMQFADGTSVA
ncbi:ATP-binding cassette, subfamily B, MsbA [Humidesulfovibrio mexicanus]|uniref:ATP-binding cassette, subfamily B, MsbA n=1 Tax=Humidesulfovibrio mexicanus TaxID=147047 RepID=A0A238XKK5_9BACT|nr:ABC transporter transmembrane domain-containing protein [Humidesulfovibrio mexicanus]SNR59240.1 ATP-binding cassette, subfamily B, MsbA [Humidesulfovibrio mexicanus]